MSGGRDMDALWQALKQQQAPGKRTSLTGFAGIPGITSRVRTYDKSKGPGQPAARPSFIAQLGESGKGQDQVQATAGNHQALLASLQRDINGLSDPDRTTRRRAAEKLHAALLDSDVAPEALQAAVAGPLFLSLVRLLADPAEKCRELAASFLAAALQRLPDPGTLLPTLVPALQERVGSLPVQEPSEEIRLALAELVAGPLLARAPRPLPDDLLPGLCAILCCQLQDPYADINKAACAGVVSLAGAAAPRALQPALQQPLVLVLTTSLGHQHSRVRMASLQALHALAVHGMPLAVMQEHVLPAVRPLAHDRSQQIRWEFYRCAAQWAGSQLRAGSSSGSGGGENDDDDDGRAANQCRSFLPLLLPLLLLALTDDSSEIRTDLYSQLEAVATFAVAQAASSSPHQATPSSMAVDQQQLPGYCHPFLEGRPSLAARCLVQAHLTRLLQQCLADLQEWTALVRVTAARVLRATLIYGEGEVLPQLPRVLQALRVAVADDDAGVATHAVGCVHVLGVNLPARHWMPLAAEAVAAEQQSAAQQTAALVMLAGLLHAASKVGSAVDIDSLRLAVATLSSPQLIAAPATAVGSPLWHQLLAACHNLLNWAGPGVAPVAQQLFHLLLQLWAGELDSQAAAAAVAVAGSAGPAGVSSTDASSSSSSSSVTAASVIAQMAAALGKSSPADLCDQFGAAMLPQVTQGHEQWRDAHPSWRALSALLRLSSGAALLQLWPAALPALQQIAADHDRDARLRLDLLQLLVALAEDASKAPAWQQAGLGQQLVGDLLLPVLQWRAGRVPAAIRYVALTALAALLGQQRLPAAQLLPLVGQVGTGSGSGSGSGRGDGGAGLLARLENCMDEDYEPDTRQLACRTLELLLRTVGPQLPMQQLAALQSHLLRRLDDSSNHARMAACGAMQPWLDALLAASGGLTDTEAANLASTVLVHTQDPDVQVAEAAGAVLQQLAAARPAAVKPLVQEAAGAHTHPALCQRILAACGSCA